MLVFSQCGMNEPASGKKIYIQISTPATYIYIIMMGNQIKDTEKGLGRASWRACRKILIGRQISVSYELSGTRLEARMNGMEV